jgi:hypothetical protein
LGNTAVAERKESNVMQKRHSTTQKKRPPVTRRQSATSSQRPLGLQKPESDRAQAAKHYEETLCRRIIDEFGFSPDSLSALRDFREMHSGEAETQP